jgi:hypothetical protein
MKTDYCAYPPQIALEVEIVEQSDGDRTALRGLHSARTLRRGDRRGIVDKGGTTNALSEEVS